MADSIYKTGISAAEVHPLIKASETLALSPGETVAGIGSINFTQSICLTPAARLPQAGIFMIKEHPHDEAFHTERRARL